MNIGKIFQSQEANNLFAMQKNVAVEGTDSEKSQSVQPLDKKSDVLEISKTVQNDSRQQDEEKNPELERLEQMADDLSIYREQWESSQESAKAQAEEIEILIKCIKISVSIISGDKVPQDDKQFLFEHQPDMYANAIILARKKESPDEKDSVLEDDDKDSFLDDMKKALGEDNISAEGVLSAIGDSGLIF